MAKLIRPEVAILFLIIASLTFALALYHGFEFFRRLPLYYQRKFFNLAGNLLLFFILFYAAIFLSDLNPTCLGCHAVNYPAQPHAKMSCLTCHQKPGLAGKTTFKLRQLKMFLYFRTYSLGLSLDCIPDSVCLNCHQKIQRTLTVKRIRVSHAEFLGRIKCMTCHENKVHAIFETEESKMEICLYCHNVSPDEKSCRKCHLGKVNLMSYVKVLELNHTTSFLQNHGADSPNKCFACHQKEDCEKCHQTFPHDKNFRPQHGNLALNNIFNCRTCHMIIKCNNCHGLEMPHRKEWDKLHGAKAVADWKQICSRCHTLASCEKCHNQKFLQKIADRVKE
jgi:ribosomal protein L40E